ncbi:MAG: glutathione peroxidase [Ignavibacteriaceae bacterium]
MKLISFLIFIMFLISVFINAQDIITVKKDVPMKNNISDISVRDINNIEVNLSDYKGKVLLIVNVASKCGYTKQYKDLQEIYEKYNEQGFEILAFPCNQFGGQEPGTNEEIAEFCSVKYGVTFKLFNKIDVNGGNRSALYERLTTNTVTEAGDVKWNFEKFLIDKKGNIVRRFLTKVKPASNDVIAAIETELAK